MHAGASFFELCQVIKQVTGALSHHLAGCFAVQQMGAVSGQENLNLMTFSNGRAGDKQSQGRFIHKVRPAVDVNEIVRHSKNPQMSKK